MSLVKEVSYDDDDMKTNRLSHTSGGYMLARPHSVLGSGLGDFI
jgi:hypothetical protein